MFITQPPTVIHPAARSISKAAPQIQGTDKAFGPMGALNPQYLWIDHGKA